MKVDGRDPVSDVLLVGGMLALLLICVWLAFFA